MSKGKLEFDLVSERSEFEDALNGWRYKFTLQELDGYLRSIIKYNNEVSEEFVEACDQLRTKLYELANENHIEIWD